MTGVVTRADCSSISAESSAQIHLIPRVRPRDVDQDSRAGPGLGQLDSPVGSPIHARPS